MSVAQTKEPQAAKTMYSYSPTHTSCYIVPLSNPRFDERLHSLEEVHEVGAQAHVPRGRDIGHGSGEMGAWKCGARIGRNLRYSLISNRISNDGTGPNISLGLVVYIRNEIHSRVNLVCRPTRNLLDGDDLDGKRGKDKPQRIAEAG